MKQLVPLIVLVLVVLGCDLSRYTSSGNSKDSNNPTPHVEPSISRTSEPEPTPAASAFFTTLKKSAGKYPNDVKLLENAEMKSRLQKLLGGDWADMKAKWNVETPMEIQGGILMASACEQHNCGSNTYIMFVDFDKDNINVVHIEDGDKKEFAEHGKIALPKKFADEIANDQNQ